MPHTVTVYTMRYMEKHGSVCSKGKKLPYSKYKKKQEEPSSKAFLKTGPTHTESQKYGVPVFFYLQFLKECNVEIAPTRQM